MTMTTRGRAPQPCFLSSPRRGGDREAAPPCSALTPTDSPFFTPALVAGLIKQQPFTSIVAVDSDTLERIAAHVPLVLDESSGCLIGHMGRGDPQCTPGRVRVVGSGTLARPGTREEGARPRCADLEQ